MKFQLESGDGQNLFSGYGDGYVAVNGTRYEKSVVVTAQRVIEDWRVEDWQALRAEHFEFLLGLCPEIVLLGTGSKLRFPPPRLTQCLAQARVGLETMDTAAACRTYNILSAEGRNVVAAVLPGRAAAPASSRPAS